MDELRFIVPIKQVPDVSQVKFDYNEGRIDRESADVEPNPFDLNALEEAVKCKEELGGEVIAISMGPKQAESTLREALARGADKAILLTDNNFAGADTWATSLTLSVGIKKLNSFHLIVCGEKTVDSDTGQVGPELAEILNIPHVANVVEVTERNNDHIKVSVDVWEGIYLKQLAFPCLITVTKDINVPRLPSLRDKLESRKATIEVWGIEKFLDILKPEDVGLRGSPTRLISVKDVVPESRKCEIIKDEPEVAAQKIITILKNKMVGF